MALVSLPTPKMSSGALKTSEVGMSQRALVWRRFKRSKVAGLAGLAVIGMYFVTAFAPFLAPYVVDQRFIEYLYVPPQLIRFDPSVGLFVYGLNKKVDLDTLRTTYAVNENEKWPVRFFVRDEPYTMLLFVQSDIHLFGLSNNPTEVPPSVRKNFGAFVFGTDRQGRDMFSRLLYGAQLSLTIGLVGVILSLMIGSVLGVTSGYYGGRIDNLMQRTIEVIRSFPAVPLWMALSAALPQNWSPEQVYFAITIILSLIGWTWLARQLRGKVLSIRTEEFVSAARALGVSDRRIIFKHLIPAVLGHIIVVATLAMPGMILAESALSFLNLGLRAPLVSWGVLLQDSQNLETIRNFPWLLAPAFAIALAVLAFNFLGDGMRDAADPYS